MNLNLLIVDDEYFIRQRLKKAVPFEELHLTFAGEAENGLEALEIIQTKPVDIILLDIKMPKMSGIELAEYVFQHHSHIKLIILSGYNDFEYARSAIRYGVTEYLLKPIDKKSLAEALSACIAKITTEQKIQFKLRQLKEREISQMLYQYLNGNLSYERAAASYPAISDYPFAMLIGCFIFEETPFAVIELVTRLSSFGVKCHYFKETDFSHTLMLLFQKTPSVSSICVLLDSFVKESEPYAFLVHSGVTATDSLSPTLYRQTHFELNSRYFHPEPSVLPLSEGHAPAVSETGAPQLRQNLMHVLSSNDTGKFHDFMDGEFDLIAEKKQIDYLTLILTEIFLTYKLHYHKNIRFQHSILDFVSLILEEEYRLTGLEDTIISYGLQCMETFTGSASELALSQKVIAYIEERYTDPDLSVTEVAEHFQFNVSYLGSVFKKTQGLSILQYLTNTRLEAARKMLAQGAKITDAANENGYSDVFYFSRRFKKKYGCSPKDFQIQSQRTE